MSLRARLAIWTLVGALVLAATLTALFARAADVARTAQLRAEGRRVALAATTLYDVLRLTGSEEDRATLQAFLSAAVNGASDKERLAWAVVVGADGSIVAGDMSAPLINVPGIDALDEIVPMQSGKLPAHLVSIDASVVARDESGAAADAPAGRVLVGLSTQSSRQVIVTAIVTGAVVSAIAAFAVAALLFAVVTRRVVKPLARVADGMNAVKAGKREPLEDLPGRGDEAGALVEGFNDMVTALVAGERSRSALERHVGKKVAGELSDLGAGPLGSGRRVRVTALFFDVEGFATRMGREQPEKIVALLQEIVAAVVDVVHQHDGHVEKLMGDTLLALWGVPTARPDDSVRAVRAALDVVERCRVVSDTQRARNEEPFSVGVGVATGDAVVASVGTSERAETVVVGEVITLARKIEREARAMGFGVLVAEETFAMVATAFEGAATPPVLVEGIGFPLTLYRVRPRRDVTDVVRQRTIPT